MLAGTEVFCAIYIFECFLTMAWESFIPLSWSVTKILDSIIKSDPKFHV